MTAASIACLESRALIRAGGEDCRSFLHILLPHDVEHLAPGELRYACLLTPQGKFLHEMFVLVDGDGCWLDVQAARRDDLLKRLNLYRLRAKVTLEPAEGHVSAMWGVADAGAGWAPDPRLPQLGFRAVNAEATPNATEDDYDAWRLSLGVPEPARDLQADRTYPLRRTSTCWTGSTSARAASSGRKRRRG